MAVKLTPRKAPRQPRAKAMVEAILIAAERLSHDPGLAAWTTNHVAELAGVSIGSLYQYFPSKASLVTALYQQRATTRLAAIADALIAEPPVGRAVAEALLEGAPAERTLDRALRTQLEADGAARKLRPLDDQAGRLFAQWLVARRRWPEPAAHRTGPAIARALASAVDADDPPRADELAALVEAMLSAAAP